MSPSSKAISRSSDHARCPPAGSHGPSGIDPPLRAPENQGKIGYFLSANNVKWRRPVLPGDTIFIEAEILKIKRNIGQAKARCVVGGQVVSEADLMFSLIDS